MFQTYFRLAGDLKVMPDWRERLERLSSPYVSRDNEGNIDFEVEDLMSRQNPLWRQTVLVESANGRVSIANRKDSREYAYRQIRKMVGL